MKYNYIVILLLFNIYQDSGNNNNNSPFSPSNEHLKSNAEPSAQFSSPKFMVAQKTAKEISTSENNITIKPRRRIQNFEVHKKYLKISSKIFCRYLIDIFI